MGSSGLGLVCVSSSAHVSTIMLSTRFNHDNGLESILLSTMFCYGETLIYQIKLDHDPDYWILKPFDKIRPTGILNTPSRSIIVCKLQHHGPVPEPVFCPSCCPSTCPSVKFQASPVLCVHNTICPAVSLHFACTISASASASTAPLLPPFALPCHVCPPAQPPSGGYCTHEACQHCSCRYLTRWPTHCDLNPALVPPARPA